jgi:hypothetical protein
MFAKHQGTYGPTGSAQRKELKCYADRCNLISSPEAPPLQPRPQPATAIRPATPSAGGAPASEATAGPPQRLAHTIPPEPWQRPQLAAPCSPSWRAAGAILSSWRSHRRATAEGAEAAPVPTQWASNASSLNCIAATGLALRHLRK